MSLESKIKDDLTAAMKAKDQEKLSVIRLLKAALTTDLIQKGKNEAADDDVISTVQKQIKQREESSATFEKAGRKDAADKERREITILQAYLPPQMSEAELTKLIQSKITEVGAKGKADMGKLMKVLMPEIKGKADGKRVNEIVGKFLGA